MSQSGDIAFGEVSSIGLQFLNNTNEKEKGSILSTAQRATNFLGNPQIKKTLTHSDFDISQLPNKLMSVYLIIKQDQIYEFQAYIRVFFDLSLSSVISQKTRGKYEVLFLLDEIAQLGYMRNLSNAISILRGMGGQMWFFFQSYSQLKSVYGRDAANILGNATQIFYGCNDIETAKIISETLGDITIEEIAPDKKSSHLIQKRLISANEVRELSTEYPIIIMSGKPGIKVRRLCYFSDKEYKGLFEQNPYH